MPDPSSVLKASISFVNFVPAGSGPAVVDPVVPYHGKRLFCRVAQGAAGELAFEVTGTGPDSLGPITGDFTKVSIRVTLDTGTGRCVIDKPISCNDTSFAFEPRFDGTFTKVILFVARSVTAELAEAATADLADVAKPATIGELTYVAIKDDKDPNAPFRIVFVDNVPPHQILVEDLPHHTNATLILPSEDGGSEVGPMGLRIDGGGP